jgi:hypothetical protein
MTMAEKISERFKDDGQVFVDKDGKSIDDVCAVACDRSLTIGDCTRYTFSDDSIITVCTEAWDFGYPECMCWQGGGHNSGCEFGAQND